MAAPLNPLHRLYKTKLALLATVSTVLGVALLLLAQWANGRPGWTWVTGMPVTDIGSALLTTGLIVIFFEYIDAQDAEVRANERLRRVLTEEAPAIRDAVVNGFAFEPDKLTNVASSATLDRVVENCLAIRLGDKELAEDAYADLREQIVRAPERLRDVDVSVALSPWEHGPVLGKGSMFVATIRWEYRMVRSNPVMRFACTSDLAEYRELLQDPSTTVVHYFERIGKLAGSSDEAFQVVQCSVDGRARPIRRTTRVGSQIYTANLGRGSGADGTEVTPSYTYRVLVQKDGHLLHLDVARPTKGFKVRFSYGNCGISHVNVLDYIASAQQPRIERLPASDPTPSVEVSFDGWVFPKAGVAFVWVLDDELVATAKQDALATGAQ